MYDEKILEQIPKACDDKRCPLHGIPMNQYIGKGNCGSGCLYFAARNNAYEAYFASWQN